MVRNVLILYLFTVPRYSSVESVFWSNLVEKLAGKLLVGRTFLRATKFLPLHKKKIKLEKTIW